MLSKNYHTHTQRCKHATGDVADYCRAAVRAGLGVLGISDHTPLPDNRWSSVRMRMEDLGDYCREIDEARAEFTGLTILKSIECEHSPEYLPFFRDELLGRLGFDYLLVGAHYFPHEDRWLGAYGDLTDVSRLRSYAKHVIASIECGLYAFIAHPDLFGGSHLEWDKHAVACSREILSAAETFKVPLEINGYGLRKERVLNSEGPRPMYPWERFWELAAEYSIEVVANSDAHRPEDVGASIEEATGIALKYGLRIADLSYLESDNRSKA